MLPWDDFLAPSLNEAFASELDFVDFSQTQARAGAPPPSYSPELSSHVVTQPTDPPDFGLTEEWQPHRFEGTWGEPADAATLTNAGEGPGDEGHQRTSSQHVAEDEHEHESDVRGDGMADAGEERG